jgi:hypothetical protein
MFCLNHKSECWFEFKVGAYKRKNFIAFSLLTFSKTGIFVIVNVFFFLFYELYKSLPIQQDVEVEWLALSFSFTKFWVPVSARIFVIVTEVLSGLTHFIQAVENSRSTSEGVLTASHAHPSNSSFHLLYHAMYKPKLSSVLIWIQKQCPYTTTFLFCTGIRFQQCL